MNSFLTLLAQATNSGSEKKEDGTGGSLFGNPLLMLLPIGILFYFIMLRPMRRQQQEQKAMTSNLKKNDKVLTSAGIYGTVVAVSETNDEVTVKVDNNVRLKVTKGSVARNITREEEAKQQKEKPKEEKAGGA